MFVTKPITTKQLENIAQRYDYLVNLFTEIALSLPLETRAQIVKKLIITPDKSPEEIEILRPILDDIIITLTKFYLTKN